MMNYGIMNFGVICLQGMMLVVFFNVMGDKFVGNKIDKDSQWWFIFYEYINIYFIGFLYVNLSGVGCLELGFLFLMFIIGKLNVDYL